MGSTQLNAESGRNGMKLSSLLWLLPLALLGLVVYVSFSALRADPRGPEKPPVVVQPNSGEAAYPRKIVESNGHEVIVKSRPLRIVPSDCGPADMLAAVVDPKMIAALPDTVDTFGGASDFYKNNPQIPRFQKFDTETVLSYKPDMVIFTTYRDPAIASYFESRGITVVRFENFRTFDGIRGSFAAIGHAVGEDEKTKIATDAFDSRLKAIEAAYSGRTKPRVISYSNYGSGFAVGTGESEDEVLRRAGAINIASELNLAGHVNFSFEQMLKANPDWIVTFGDQGLDSQQARFLLTEPTLANLDAIKQKHIAVIPDKYYSSISQYILDATEILAKQLHADAFPKKDDAKENSGTGVPAREPAK